MALTEKQEHIIALLEADIAQLKAKSLALEAMLRAAILILGTATHPHSDDGWVEQDKLDEFEGARNDLVDVVKDILKNDGESDATIF